MSTLEQRAVEPGLVVPPEAYADELAAQPNGHDKSAKAVVLRHISEIVAEKREPEWLLHKIVERNALAVLAGPRGTFKSFIALDWSMRMALDGHAGVILSGEGAGLDRRIAAWLNQHRESADITQIPLYALERALNLTAVVDMAGLTAAIAALNPALEFIVIDTFSKFSTGLDENDNGKVAAFLSALSEHLREALACTVILVAHSGHGEAQRPRGASALMSNPDAEFMVARPDPLGMSVTVTRERFKDCASLTPLAYEAKVIDLGRVDAYGEPVTSLALVLSDAPAPAAGVRGRGKNQDKMIVALREWVRAHPSAVPVHITSIDIRGICQAQHIDRKREREVLDAFVNVRILTPSIGGYILHTENL
jgi:hypothetical protein